MSFSFENWNLKYGSVPCILTTNDDDAWVAKSEQGDLLCGPKDATLGYGYETRLLESLNIDDLKSQTFSFADVNVPKLLGCSGFVYGLYRDDALVSVAGISVRKAPYLDIFYTPPSSRGFGYASILVRWLAETYLCMYAHVNESNASSIKALSKAGFVSKGRVPLYYEEEDFLYETVGFSPHAVLMTYDLNIL